MTGRPAGSLRRLALDSAGVSLSAAGFGIVYGLAAREAGFSIVEALAMSVFVLAGASQFAAVGLVAQGVPWAGIVVLTGFLNARHVLYSAALAPYLAAWPALGRAAGAHLVTDETFALWTAHFRRLGRADVTGFLVAAGFVTLPWIGATVIGHVGGQAFPDPRVLGLDVVFPAAMAGLVVVLGAGRRDVVAAAVGGGVAVATGLSVDPALGVVAGGLLGPLAGLVFPGPERPAGGELDPRGLARDPGLGAAP